MVLLDTCVISRIESHRLIMSKVLSSISKQKVAIPFPVFIEVVGSLPVSKKNYMKKVLEHSAFFFFDEKCFAIAKKICFRLKIAPSDRIDLTIACIAIANELPLITENADDFEPFIDYGLSLKTYNLAAATADYRHRTI